VGVVSADVILGLPDFRAAERTFQLLTQVAGRAGRGELPGEVLVQTYYPEHYAIEMAARQDFASFFEKELHFRRMMHYPPFTALANIIVRDRKIENAIRWSRALAAFLPALATAILLLSAFALSGTETNLLHAVSLLIVMGMGVDYGIFVVDSSAKDEDLGATLVSCLLCCLTTILGFGTLALSSHPALRAIGLTTGVGIVLSLVLAPLSLLALRADSGPGRDG